MPTDRELLDEAVRLLRRTVTWSGGTWPAEVIAFVAKVDARPAAPPRADHDWSDERVTNDCQHCARCGVAWLQGVAPPGPCAPPRAEAPAPRVDRNGHPPRVAAHLVANCGLPESSAAPAR
jgi:hypothetical protein